MNDTEGYRFAHLVVWVEDRRFDFPDARWELSGGQLSIHGKEGMVRAIFAPGKWIAVTGKEGT